MFNLRKKYLQKISTSSLSITRAVFLGMMTLSLMFAAFIGGYIVISEMRSLKKETIKIKIRRYSDSPVFFTSIAYDSKLYGVKEIIEVADVQKENNVIVAGIAKPTPFFDFFKNTSSSNTYLTFPDHHDFSTADIAAIKSKAEGHKIITTEKDYMRLKGLLPENQLYYLPIQTQFLGDEELFQNVINETIQSKK